MTSLQVLFIAAVPMSNIVVTFYHGNRLIFLFPIIISMVLFSWLICKAFLIVIFGLQLHMVLEVKLSQRWERKGS